ncbi:MAG: penicillin-binding protein 2, partial [Pseudomonadota bacterium]
DGIDSESWQALSESLDKPLLNRALRGTYPPGSTYKPFMAMAALQSGKRSATTIINDNASYTFGGHTFRSHGDIALGAVDMYRSIVKSSNVYYYSLANEMGVDLIHDQMDLYTFGRKTGIDLEGESTGDLPSTEWKRNKYKRPEQKRWYAGETISLGIGQGYNNFTMLQLATAMSTLVSGGLRFEPRVVHQIENVVTRERRTVSSQSVAPLNLKPEHVAVVRRALYGVTQTGTSTRVFVGAPYQSGGKTGTAQAVGVRQNEKYNASKLADYQRDHSLYTAFAPLDDPRIALALIVENAGFGAEAAAPIARRVLDYVISGVYPTPEDIAIVQKGHGAAPAGPGLPVASVPLPPTRAAGVDAESAATSAAASALAFPASAAMAASAPGSAPAAAPASAPAVSPLAPTRPLKWVPRRTPPAAPPVPAASASRAPTVRTPP